MFNKEKPENIAFLYNVRHKYPDLDDNKTQLEVEYDDPEAIQWMVKHLVNIGYKVLEIEANEVAYQKLHENRKNIDIVFNYSEGLHGNDREAHLPAMLEMLELPYTGSTPLTQALVLNKVKAKDLASSYSVPVLVHQLVYSKEFELSKNLKFPLIVKPVSQGSSAGITNSSVVESEKSLKKQVDYVLSLFNQPVIIEPFLQGREFSVPMLGNPPEILPIIESDHSKLPENFKPIDSLEVKWFFEEETDDNNLICPAKVSLDLKTKLLEICNKVWQSLEIRDLCRIDIRCDKDENPYFLEVNSPPGLIPPEVSKTSYFPYSAKVSGLDYESLLNKIIETAWQRYKISIDGR